jgi:probable selenium-dependent hydroxylase accessory protein YqeC
MWVSTPSTLWTALKLDAATPPVVALVGGGGKTTALFRLGREARERGRSAVLTGTTRFTQRAHLSEDTRQIVCPAPDVAPDLTAAIEAGATAVVHAGAEPKSRWAPIAPEVADAMARAPGLGLLAIEADGSKMLAFKAPSDYEPVIPTATTHVVAVVGLSALDEPLVAGRVHRPERIRAIVRNEERASAAVIARVMTDQLGGRKDVGTRDFTVLVNQADLDPDQAHGLAETVRAAGAPRVIVAALRSDDPIRAVLGG